MHQQLPEATTVHWHGLIVPNEMDGPAEITQAPIEPGERFVYDSSPANPGRTSTTRTASRTASRPSAATVP